MSLEHSPSRDGPVSGVGDGELEDDLPDRFLRDREVEHIVGLSRTTIWRLERQGLFPKKVKLSPNRRGRSERQVRRWMRERMEAAA